MRSPFHKSIHPANRRFGFACCAFLFLISTLFAESPSWTSNGPYGGTFQSFLFHPSDPSLIFASGFDGLFRSTDTGKTWRRLTAPGGEFVVRVHPKNPGLILAANATRGIFSSTDRGDTWTLHYSYEFTSDAFYDMEFQPEDPQTLFAVSYYHGVYKSTDAGETWVARNNGLNLKPVRDCCVDIPQLEIDPTNGKLLYALMPSRQIFRSGDGGDSWKSISNGLKFMSEEHALAIDPRNTLVLYAGGSNGIYRTLNGGQQWSSRNCNCYIWSFSANPHNALEVYGVGEGALKSNDGGKSWTWFSPHPFLSGILMGVGVHPQNPGVVLVGGFGGGIFRSSDSGRTWNTVNDQLDALNVVRMVADPKKAGHLYALGGQQVFETMDGGKSWDLFLKGQSSAFWASDIVMHPANPKMIVVAGYRKKPGALTISLDGGKTWETRTIYAGVNYGCSNCIALDPEDQNTIYLAPFLRGKDNAELQGVSKSTDQGKTWKLINSGITAKDVWMIQVSPSDSSVVFAGTGSGKLFRSTNAGKSWDATENLDGSSIRAMAFDPVDHSILYVSTYDSIFKSFDSGKTWTRKSQGLPDAWLNFVGIDPGNRNKIFAVGEAGIFVSADSGESWTRLETQPGPFAAWNLLIDPFDPSKYYAGTDRGVFTISGTKF